MGTSGCGKCAPGGRFSDGRAPVRGEPASEEERRDCDCSYSESSKTISEMNMGGEYRQQ